MTKLTRVGPFIRCISSYGPGDPDLYPGELTPSVGLHLVTDTGKEYILDLSIEAARTVLKALVMMADKLDAFPAEKSKPPARQ